MFVNCKFCGRIIIYKRGDSIKSVSKFAVEKTILIPLILFGIISVVSIFSTKELLDAEFHNLWLKQIFWYGLGFCLAYLMMFFGNKFLYNNAWTLYIIGVILLILVLIFGVDVNNARCWFRIPYIGTFQPSEFMKIFLIIIIARLINEFNEQYLNPSVMDEFKFLLKILAIVLIPSALTFIQPDTGAVMLYCIITFVMLFIGGFRKRWFVAVILCAILFGGSFIALYFLKQDLFIDIFGTSFFYRMDRILNWSNSSGMQLTNSLIAIGSAGLLGHGVNNIPIYFPEMQNDFIFAVFTSCFGLVGAILLIILIVFFDISLITTTSKTTDMTDKYMIGGILAVLLFQQIYNISMTIGLLPIMGITLPFISYGGSSLLSYMLLVGLIFNVSNESMRFTN